MEKISHPQSTLLVYGIREIVDVARKLKTLNPAMELTYENIGDPVAKGWPVPPFLKKILQTELARTDNRSFAYTHSRGRVETRQWAVEYAKRFCPSVTLNYENILFTNGLGAAISMLYQMIKPGGRILQPSPAYPTHASFESFAAGAPPILYTLNPDRGWEPDVEDIETQLKIHPEIIGLNIINPNNPTGAVYSQATLERIINLAEKYELMIISDEIYFRMVFSGATHVPMAELAHGRIPLIVLRGLSKDVPWPGGRCGWIEFHNTELSTDFKNYCESIKKRVLLEVCSSTLPQIILPQLYDHPDFAAWNAKYTAQLQVAAQDIAARLSVIPELSINETAGAFYMMPLFKAGVLNRHQTLPLKNSAIRTFIEQATSQPNFPLDKRFTYYLLAATGIVTVPTSDFFSSCLGFRLTTLERDPAKRKITYQKFVESTKQYLQSA